MKSLLSDYDKTQITEAINKELYAFYLYNHIANHMQRIGFFGAQKYFLNEAEHEKEHYSKWVDFCNDRGDVASLTALPAMESPVKGIREAFEMSLKAEVELMDFYDTFYEESEDCFTKERLLEFLNIQRTSVGEVMDYLSRLDICGDNSAALLIFDNELKQ